MKDFVREENCVKEKSYLDMTQRTNNPSCSGNYEKEKKKS